VTGFFVDGTIQVTNDTRETIIKEAQSRKSFYIEFLRDLFHELDTDESGVLCWDELQARLYDEDLQSYFCVLDLAPDEAEDLFNMLDLTGSGEVNINDFVDGCMRVMGPPKSKDIWKCLFQTKKTCLMLEVHANEKDLQSIEIQAKNPRQSRWRASSRS